MMMMMWYLHHDCEVQYVAGSFTVVSHDNHIQESFRDVLFHVGETLKVVGLLLKKDLQHLMSDLNP